MPAVGGVDVAWAGRRDADQIGQRSQEYVVAGSGPRFLKVELIRVVQVGVVEEVDGLPAAAGSDVVGGQDLVEVFAAVDVARVAHVLVVLGVAGRVEGVVATHRVVDDLHHGLEVQRVVLGEQAGHGVAGTHEAAGDGGVQRGLHSTVQTGGVEALEVGALPTLDVDDLDELASLHLVGPGGGRADSEVLVLVGQRRGEHLEARGRGGGAVDEGDDVGRRVLLVGEHLPAGHTDDTDQVGRCGQPGFQAGRGVGGEQVDGGGRSEVDALGGQRVGDPPGVVLVGGQDCCDARRRGTRRTVGEVAQ